eukprot:m.84087 g.84087  ORF g.84087 m.84087 type:complete len:60 (-) comp12952_c0_seq5:1344-1523(-)
MRKDLLQKITISLSLRHVFWDVYGLTKKWQRKQNFKTSQRGFCTIYTEGSTTRDASKLL